MDGITSSGFKYHVEEATFDNMELLDALEEMTDEDSLAISRVVKLVLGEEQKKLMYNHLRTADGRVPIVAVNKEIAEIFDAFGTKGKNS